MKAILTALSLSLSAAIAIAAGPTRTWTDVPYGQDARQRLDVYAPDDAKAAPVVFMVHGGAWMVGDKSADNVVKNKVDHWLPRGYIVVSVNYRMLPRATPLEQARDVAQALAMAQERAASWGGDRGKFILMGHSAGAHLVAMIATSPALSQGAGATPVLGTVLLDSAALDVVEIMQGRHLRLYDRAFGSQPDTWTQVSPYHLMSQPTAPILAVCSSERRDACPQAERFVAKAVSLGSRASVLPQALSHNEINKTLGEDSAYTAAVDQFMQTLLTPAASSLRPAKQGG
jgi:acetyl esterase/lipase